MQIEVARPVETFTARPSSGKPQDVSLRSSIASADKSTRFDFENITVGQFTDAINDLYASGRLSDDEFRDICWTCWAPMPPAGTSQEEFLAMPMGFSYDRFREIAHFANIEGRIEERDRHERVLNLLQQFDGTPRKLDVSV